MSYHDSKIKSIRLAHQLDEPVISLNNGPGYRWIIWTQGCSIQCCHDCINANMIDPTDGYEYDIQSLIDCFQAVCEKKRYHSQFNQMVSIEGVTVLGGEPTDQATSLVPFCRHVQLEGKTVMLYTGWSRDALLNHEDQSIQDLLQHVDILIDGPYISTRYNSHLMWRGSANQQLYILSQAYTMDDIASAFDFQGKGFQFHYAVGGQFTLSGIQSGGYAKELNQ